MRFRRNEDAEEEFSAMFPGRPGFSVFCANAGDWQFVVTLDKLHGSWAASYKPRHGPDMGKQALQCDEPRPDRGERHRQYDSQREAEQACERKYKQLRANN